MPEVIPGVFIDGKPVPLPPPQATHLALCLDVPNFKGFRKFFLRTIERKNYSCEKYGEGLEGGIKKLKHCLQKGNAKLHYIGEQDNYYTFRVKGPLGGWGLEETIKEFGEFIRHVHLKSSTYGRYLRKNQFMWKFFWCTNKDQILVPLTKEEAAEQEAQDCALAKPIRIPLPQVVRKDAVKILKQLGGVMEILDYLNKRFCPYSFILKGSPRTLYIDNCPADAWDGSEAKREVKELFSEMTNLAVEKKRRNLTLQANATKTLIQKAKAKEALPSAEDAETPVLKVPKEHQPWPHEPRQLQRHEDESAETPVLKVEEKKKAQVVTAKEEATAKDDVLAPSRARAREKTLQAMRRRAKSVEVVLCGQTTLQDAHRADTCGAAGNRVKDIIPKKEEKKEEHSPAKVERKPVILKAAQARAQEETRDEPQPEKKKIILKAASEIAAEQASQVQEEEADYNEGAVRARQQDLQEKMKMCLAKANIQKKEDNRTTDNDKTAVKQKDLAEVEYRFFSRGVADAKDQGDDIEEDEAGDTEVEDASDEEQAEAETADVTEAGDTEVEDASDEEDEEQEEAKTADVTEAGDTEVEDASDEEDEEQEDKAKTADVTQEAEESEEDGRDRREVKKVGKQRNEKETHRRPRHRQRRDSKALRDSKGRKSPPAGAKQEQRRRRRRSRRREPRSRRRERRKDEDEERRPRQQEVEEARRKKEEEQSQRAEEDERRRKLEEEARRKKEEVRQEQRQRAEEDERRRKLEEEARRKKEEEQRQRAEEDERRRKLEEEARRKNEEEQRQRAEEDERRRKLEEEARGKKEEEKRRQEEEKAARSEEEGSWSPQDGQDQDEDKEENIVAKRRRTKQARRLTQANERRIMQGWTWRNQFQEALAPEAKIKKQEEAEEAEEVLRQKADEAERKRQQMMEEARQREIAQAEEKRRMQEEASQGEKVEEEERQKRQLEEVPRIQEAAPMPHTLQVPAQMRPPTRPKAPYPSGIRLRVFEKAGARELPERRIVKQALTFGTGGHCDVVLPPGPGVQGEHLKLGHHELKGWSLQPISGISVQSAVACYPALLEKLQLECQRLPQGQKKDEVIDLLYRLSKDERTSRLTQGGEGRLKLSENLCVFTLGNAKTPKRLYFLDLIFGELLKEDPLMDLAEVAPVPAAPKEVPQMAEIQVQGPQPEAEEAPCDPADPAQEDMQVNETVEQNQAAPTVQDVPSEPNAKHADADTVDAIKSMTAPVPDETPSKAQQVETLHAADGELLCEDAEDGRPDHDDQSHTRQEDPEQVEAKMGEEQQEDTTVEGQQDAEMPALSKEVLGGEDPFAEDDASGSEHVSHVSEVTQEDSPKDADVKDLKELSEPKEGQDEHAAEVAEAAKTEVPLVTPEVAATVATSKAPGPQIVRPAAKPKAIPSKVVEVKHHYDGPVADFVQQAENLALQKYAKMPLIGHRPRNETWRWRARRAPVAEDEKLSKDPGASPIDGFPDSGETWKDIAKARATRIILKRVREEADASRNEWQKQREKKRRMPLPPKVPEKIYNHLRNAYKAYKLFSPWLSPVMRMQLTQEIWYTVRYVEDQFADELFWRRAAGEKMDVPIPVHQVKLPVVAVAKKPPMEPPPRKRSRSPRRKQLRFETLKVPVDEVEFSQDSIAQRFTCGRHLQSTVADMRSGELDPLDVKQYPFMKLLALRIDDRIISRCNRRLWCLHEVQRLRRSRKPDHNEYVWVKVQEPSEVLKDMIRKILPPKPRLAARLTDQMVEDDDLGALMAEEAED